MAGRCPTATSKSRGAASPRAALPNTVSLAIPCRRTARRVDRRRRCTLQPGGSAAWARDLGAHGDHDAGWVSPGHAGADGEGVDHVGPGEVVAQCRACRVAGTWSMPITWTSTPSSVTRSRRCDL